MFTNESGPVRQGQMGTVPGEAAAWIYRCEPSDDGGGIEGVHASACSIWDMPPQFSPGAILQAGIVDEGAAVYLAQARPLYDAAKRCIGQLSGVLLLLQTGSLERSRDGLILGSVALQLREAKERLSALRPPSGALRHQALLAELLALLAGISARLDRLRDLLDRASPDLDAVVTALFSAHRSLLALSEPRAGLAPVDFSAACCNCRPKTKN